MIESVILLRCMSQEVAHRVDFRMPAQRSLLG